MIKEVQEIPTGNEKSTTLRDKIVNDLQDGLNSGLNKFEFVGYTVNEYKYLRQNAAWEGQKLARRIAIDKARKMFPEVEYVHVYVDTRITDGLFKVSSVKDEQQGRRVFCKIERNVFDTAIDKVRRLILEEAEKKAQKA